MFSLEMSAEQLATRLLAEEARISGDRIRRGDIGQKDFDRFVQVCARDRRAAAAYRRHARRSPCRRCAPAAGGWRAPRGCRWWWSTICSSCARPPASRPENRVLEISQITQGLKAHRQGAGGAGAGAVAAVARGGKPRGQAAAAVRPARIGLDRAGRRRGDVRLPRRILPAAARAQAARLRQRGKIPQRGGEMAARHGARA